MSRRGSLLAALLVASAAAIGLGFAAHRGAHQAVRDTSGEAAGRETSDPVLGGAGARATKSAASQAGQGGDRLAPLPRDLPTWGLRVHVVTAGQKEAGLPVVGAEVRAALAAADGDLAEWNGTTNEEGVCRLGPLVLPTVPRHLLGSVVLQTEASYPDHGSSWRSERGLGPLAERVRRASDEAGVRWVPVTVKLWAIRQAHGRLLTSSGHPVTGVWVDPDPCPRGFGAGRTDLDGRFGLPVARAGTAELELEFEVGGQFDIRHRVATEVRPDSGELEVRLPGGDEAGGHVTDAEGKAVAGIHLVLAAPWWDPNVTLTLARGGYTPPLAIERMHTRSATDGRFAFAGLKEREPYVLWWPENHLTWQRLEEEVHRGDQDLSVVVTRHRFRILLQDAVTGEAVQGRTRLRLLGEDGKPVYPELRVNDAVPREEGRVASPGQRFRVFAWARGYGVATSVFTVPEAPGTHEVAVPLAPLGAEPDLRLRFVDDDGNPLGRLPVLLQRKIEGLWGDLDLDLAFEDAGEGWLRLRHAPPGTLHLETPEKLGHPPSGAWRFTLPVVQDLEVPAEGRLDAEIPCPQGGSIRLHLNVQGSAEDRPMGTLRVAHESGDDQSPWWYAAKTDGDWEFEIIGDGRFEPDGRTFESYALTPGAWTLEITESEHWRAVSLPLRIAPGDITDLYVQLEARD